MKYAIAIEIDPNRLIGNVEIFSHHQISISSDDKLAKSNTVNVNFTISSCCNIEEQSSPVRRVESIITEYISDRRNSIARYNKVVSVSNIKLGYMCFTKNKIAIVITKIERSIFVAHKG